MAVKDLGQNLLIQRKARGISQKELAEQVGLSLSGYRKIERGESEPRASNLISLSRALGVGIVDLLNDPVQYKSLRFREGVAATRKHIALKEHLLRRFHQWILDYCFLERALHEQRRCSLPESMKPEAKLAAAEMRRQLNVKDDEPIDDIVGLLDKADVKLYVFNVDLPNVFGFSAGESDGGPAIAVNTAGVTVERQIFTSVHELGHLILHKASYTERADDLAIRREESEADAFAGYFLMPEAAFNRELAEARGLPPVEMVLHIKRKFRVSYKAVLRRLVNDYGASDSLYQRFAVWYNLSTGKDLKNHREPEPLTEHEFVEDRLSRLVRKAYTEGIISESRASGMLRISIDEFRQLEMQWAEIGQ